MFCGSQPLRIPLFWEMAAQFTFKCRCKLYCNRMRLGLCFHVYKLWFLHLLNKRSYKNRLGAVTKLLQGSSCGLYTMLVMQGKLVTGLYTDPHSHKAAGGYCGTPFQVQTQELFSSLTSSSLSSLPSSHYSSPSVSLLFWPSFFLPCHLPPDPSQCHV